MVNPEEKPSFFSISFDLVLTRVELPYDLFINSSANKNERFIRVFPKGGILQVDDLKTFKRKYFQVYVSEGQRSEYLKSLGQNERATEFEKGEIIKDSAIHYLDKLFDEDKEFTTELLQETIEGCRDSVESMVDMVQDYTVDNLQDLIASLSFHDFYTYDHSINVSMYCIMILKTVRPNASQMEMVTCGMGGLLHDLGKIKIPTDIINNPGKLTDEQFAQIKKHPDYGLDLLHSSGCSCEGADLKAITRVVHEHHENYNGTGYPSKIEGEEIHLFARITAMADFFDAITTKRSYHEVLSIEEALKVMASTKGKKLDPRLFDVFCQNAQKFVNEDKVKVGLKDEFDPCQPREALPLTKLAEVDKAGLDTSKESGFGKVNVLDSWRPKKKKTG